MLSNRKLFFLSKSQKLFFGSKLWHHSLSSSRLYGKMNIVQNDCREIKKESSKKRKSFEYSLKIMICTSRRGKKFRFLNSEQSYRLPWPFVRTNLLVWSREPWNLKKRKSFSRWKKVFIIFKLDCLNLIRPTFPRRMTMILGLCWTMVRDSWLLCGRKNDERIL